MAENKSHLWFDSRIGGKSSYRLGEGWPDITSAQFAVSSRSEADPETGAVRITIEDPNAVRPAIYMAAGDGHQFELVKLDSGSSGSHVRTRWAG